MASILIADDDEVFGQAMERFFTDLGHTVYRVLDGQQVVFAIQKHRFDLVVLDVQMPGGGAPTALRRLCAQPSTAALPIIAVSGMPVEQQRQWFPDRSDVRCFCKPISFPELRAAVVELLTPPPARPPFR